MPRTRTEGKAQLLIVKIDDLFWLLFCSGMPDIVKHGDQICQFYPRNVILRSANMATPSKREDGFHISVCKIWTNI